MAGNAFDRQVINTRERPLSSDINAAQSQVDRTLREFARSLFSARVGFSTSDLTGNPPNGFLGSAFKARASAVPGLSVVLDKGIGFEYLVDPASGVGGVSGVDDLSEFKPLCLLVDTTIAGIAAGDGANPRIDIIEVRMNRALGNPLSRDVLNPGTGVFVATSVNKTLSFTQDGSVGVVTDPAASTAAISYKQGIPGAVPVEPTVTAGYVKIATLKIPAALAAITKSNIIDQRPILCPAGLDKFHCDFTVPIGAATPPSGLRLFSQPGLELVVQKLDTANNNRFKVWLIGGAPPVDSRMSGHVLQANSATEFYTLQSAGNFGGQLTSGQVTDLANANISTPAQTWAVGTNYVACEFFLLHQAAGVTNAVVPASFIAVIDGSIKRY